ncbi:MAG: low molecular weight phosphotyrosine protein phosphatase [Anaerolineales bacterium]|nr:low molecular weight phosphotyrosine protein phosphatase [Anaerolineales bacterium]
MTLTCIAFVCSGNICRSPLAEAVFAHLVREAGHETEFDVESFGTGPWHVGEGADPRAQRTARAHGLLLSGTAQQITSGDFARLDLAVALDTKVAAALRQLAPTPADRAKVRLLREFDPGAVNKYDLDVPDPYYSGPDGFELAYQMIERSARRLLEALGRPLRA